MRAKTSATVLLAVLSLLLSSPAVAHKVRIFAWQEGETIHSEAKFSGGRPAQNARILVTDQQSGRLLIEGTTDSNGLFSFPQPDPAALSGGNIEITVDSGDGHKNSWIFEIATTAAATAPPTTLRVEPATAQRSEGQTITVSPEQLSLLIEQALDKQLTPIRRSLAESADKDPSIQDILGGIGYILGLAGLAAYFASRQKKGRST
jgi:nickel transport protein